MRGNNKMKQISDEILCKYCLGCNKLENENFAGVRRCNGFCPGYDNWKKLYYDSLNKKNKNH